MTMMPRLLRKFRRSLQFKQRNLIANAPCVLQFVEYPKYTYQSITVKNGRFHYRDSSDVAKKAAEVAQKKEQ